MPDIFPLSIERKSFPPDIFKRNPGHWLSPSDDWSASTDGSQQEQTQSMSRKGNCWDNAVAESFFKTIKHEWLYRFKFNSNEQLYESIQEYIDWYNTKRLHSSLGYLTPLEMEIKLNEISKKAA